MYTKGFWMQVGILDTGVYWIQVDTGYRCILDTGGYWIKWILDKGGDTGYRWVLDTGGY